MSGDESLFTFKVCQKLAKNTLIWFNDDNKFDFLESKYILGKLLTNFKKNIALSTDTNLIIYMVAINFVVLIFANYMKTVTYT